MRLICPNCGAQYEVDDRVIPTGGRDVQCSACSYTWFQPHPSQDAGLVEELGIQASPPRPPAPQAAPPAASPDARQADTRETAPKDTAPPQVAARAGEGPHPEEPRRAAATAEEAPEASRRGVDPDVMSVLREEAERERAARIAEREALEMQGDLDLEEPPAARRPMPSVTDAVPRTGASVAARTDDGERASRTAPRRDLLPDIEEINSTLEPGAEGPAASARIETPEEREARLERAGGRRIGFAIACAVFAVLTLVYSQAPRIAGTVPAVAPALDAYVSRVDTTRLWLDGALRRAAEGASRAGLSSG